MRGLLRAAALETRLAHRPDPRSDDPPAPDPCEPRPPRPVRRPTIAADPRLASLPSADDIAAEIRRRPVGAVIADICRDLGITPSNPLWQELSLLIISNGGDIAPLHNDILERAVMGPFHPPAALPPADSAPHPPFALTPGTGPP